MSVVNKSEMLVIITNLDLKKICESQLLYLQTSKYCTSKTTLILSHYMYTLLYTLIQKKT